jgi:hypothetical protein
LLAAWFFIFLPPLSGAEENQIRFVTWKAPTEWFWDQAIADFEARNPARGRPAFVVVVP